MERAWGLDASIEREFRRHGERLILLLQSLLTPPQLIPPMPPVSPLVHPNPHPHPQHCPSSTGPKVRGSDGHPTSPHAVLDAEIHCQD